MVDFILREVEGGILGTVVYSSGVRCGYNLDMILCLNGFGSENLYVFEFFIWMYIATPLFVNLQVHACNRRTLSSKFLSHISHVP